MSLQGSLSEFTLVDLLRLLELSSRTGVVRFTRQQGTIAQNATIYFRDGKAVAAEVEELAGDTALEVLCSWDSGAFAFREGATSPRENLDRPVDSLLKAAAAAQEEWREIRRVLPAPSATVRVASNLPSDVSAVELDRDEWILLARMVREEPLSTWVHLAGSGLPAYRVLRKLAESGLISVTKQEARS